MADFIYSRIGLDPQISRFVLNRWVPLDEGHLNLIFTSPADPDAELTMRIDGAIEVGHFLKNMLEARSRIKQLAGEKAPDPAYHDPFKYEVVDLLRQILDKLPGKMDFSDLTPFESQWTTLHGGENTASGGGGSEPDKVHEVEPHTYSPSVMHQGDCSICGHVAESPLHIKPVPLGKEGGRMPNFTTKHPIPAKPIKKGDES